ncbi:MBL fold metallo-hydrolase [Collinsella sp. zg1085]|uniref:MBL fold metallo-hydrolase n=1 Tax=Collinsella sp. zg1085 TaxID=2844380 RepID=UPI001C0C4B27|nr:MBL fold metallo-hydrolase [Collinsella sp. zg1085]QWT18134.1 MBL fold metallo-hydrolase [Collinsella sp. zg1085]
MPLALLHTKPQGHLTVDCIENGPINTNTYVLISQGEALIVDPAWDGAELLRLIAERHPNISIKGLLCTHGHADHLGGVAGIRRMLGEQTPYLISAIDAQFVPAARASMKRMWGVDVEDPGKPTRLLHEGDVIQLGDVELQAILVPGHTKGGMVYFAATNNGNFAFVGDTLFPGGHGRTDLEGGNTAEILQSLAKMAHLMPDDTLCLIGHGPTTTIGKERAENAFMIHALRHYPQDRYN